MMNVGNQVVDSPVGQQLVGQLKATLLLVLQSCDRPTRLYNDNLRINISLA